MSLLIADIFQPNAGQDLNLDGNVQVTGNLSANTIYGNSSSLTKPIYNITPIGDDIGSVNVYLEYGINVINSASTTNFCVRMPQTPIEGREIVVINNSGIDIYIFPSMAGGSINGNTNGATVIPSDSKAYKFICYENPNPGAWSSNNTLAAPGQYDSGIISIDTTLGDGSGYISAYNDTFKNNANSFASYNAGFDGLNKPYILYSPYSPSCQSTCAVVYFKPTTPWAFIDKVTVYTNFTSGATTPGTFGLLIGENANYYSAGTTFFLQNGPGRAGSYMNPWNASTNQLLVGSANNISPGYTATPGEPGTYYGELIYNLADRPSMIGDILLSSGTMYVSGGNLGSGVYNVDYWNCNYITFIYDTNRVSPNVKIRFVIDYVI